MNLAPSTTPAKAVDFDEWLAQEGDMDEPVFIDSALCLCGSFEFDHGDDPDVAAEERRPLNPHTRCRVCYEGRPDGATVGCDKFTPSPYFCPVCRVPQVSADDAVFCCITRCCGHLVDSHRSPKRALLRRVLVPCAEPNCGCRFFVEYGAVAS